MRPFPLPRLRVRPADSHKGDYGRVLIVAGSVEMAGAAVLAGEAAMRSGAGLVTVAMPKTAHDLVRSRLVCETTIRLPETQEGAISAAAGKEILRHASCFDAFAVGPGLSMRPGALVPWLAARLPGPVVLDADALNILAKEGIPKGLNGRVILTPHPGEMARLARMTTAAVQSDREGVASAFAKKHGVVVLLKGHRTVATDGVSLCVNRTGNPGMATGGSGDVLTGLVAGLLAQGYGPLAAAALGAHLHGLAGDLAARAKGQEALVATDILEALPAAFVRTARAGG
ncbi:MAG: NAD(P)H-hydrate dehydratase [Planctomycetota bacterium]